MNQPKINKTLQSKLFSSSTQEVVWAIEQLKEKGNRAYLPLLFQLMASDPEEEIRKAILKLLGNVKDKESIPMFAEALQNEELKNIRKDLLITCWQNGMDFRTHFDVFLDIIISENWEIAFEAFTVIENLKSFPQGEEGKNLKLKTARALKEADTQKAYFFEEILKMWG